MVGATRRMMSRAVGSGGARQPIGFLARQVDYDQAVHAGLGGIGAELVGAVGQDGV